MNLLEVKKLSKYYSEEFALKNINLNLKKGEVHGIIGENGSGKTCFMKNISGFEKPDLGLISINGKEVKDVNYLAKNILFIMQEPNLFANLTVAENIYFDEFIINKSPIFNYMDVVFRSKEVLQELSIGINPLEKVSNLTLAQKQLIEVAKAYVSNCSMIIFDEPTTTFTDIESNILFNVIDYLKEKGLGIIFISHKLKEIRKICTSLSIFTNGSAVTYYDLKSLSDDEILKTMASRPFLDSYPKVNIKKGNVVLEIKNLSSGNVLHNISLTLKQGEVLGITGLVGSGRTYLSNYLFGSICKNKIDTLFKEKNVSMKNTKDAIENNMIMLPENRETAVFGKHNALFNTTIASLKRFISNNTIQDDLLERQTNIYFEKFHVFPNKTENDIETFSSGNQQKIIFLRLIMTNSLIYILDEPTRGIDIPTKIDIYNCINDIVAKGGSVMILSSDIDELLGMADRILIMEEGRIVKESIPDCTDKEEILMYATGRK
ncbi:MAG: sugar ABC transporter ATP-binding protein [Lachnospirales bacterium]